MGVPGFARTLFKKYKNIVSKYEDKNIDNLYLDANCLIHPVCLKTYYDNKNVEPSELERKMCNAVIEYITFLTDMVKPNKLIYIAVDGVAPMAKIKHQRLRRFKSVREYEIKASIAKKYNIDYPRPWNNSAISPGTIFMSKLTTAIFHNIKNKENVNKYIFSTYNTPSEGEHKILQHIKKSIESENTMIYGLDADLIYLALAANKSNIYLLRESKEINTNLEGFSIIDIDKMKQAICDEITHHIDLDRFIKDYIFIGFLLGNDFLPALPSTNYRFPYDNLNGYTIIIKIYNEVFTGDYIITIDNKINIDMFKLFISRLASIEDLYFKESVLVRQHIPQCESNNPFDQQIHNLENLLFKIDDPIKFQYPGYKERYYTHYNINKKDAIEKYLEGLQWTMQYYYDECGDWLWYYNYEQAPFVSDIKEYLDNNEFKYSVFNDKQIYVKPLQQLLMIIPHKSRYLLPKSYQHLSSPNDKFELDFLMKNKFWQAVPRIDMINSLEIINKTKNIKLDSFEELRNTKKEDIKFI
jgi:5'-3' exonuclease